MNTPGVKPDTEYKVELDQPEDTPSPAKTPGDDGSLLNTVEKKSQHISLLPATDSSDGQYLEH